MEDLAPGELRDIGSVAIFELALGLAVGIVDNGCDLVPHYG